MIGEIGGPQEAEAAAFSRDHMKKPVSPPPARPAPPAGPPAGPPRGVASPFADPRPAKVEILKAPRATIAPNPSEMGAAVAKTLSGLRKVA